MYEDLYRIWKQELEDSELVKLPSNFYPSIADYIRKLGEEGRMLDKRTAKASLLKKEVQNVRRMIMELLQTRYRKLIKTISKGEEIPLDALADEEKEILSRVFPLAETYHNFTENILHGNVQTDNAEQRNRRMTALRFLKDIPEIIGADMKSYGPFKVEDIASLPKDNAKILIKQGMVEKIDTC